MNNIAYNIIDNAIKASSPYSNVANTLKTIKFSGNITVVAVGKAAVPMAKAANDILRDSVKSGYVLTKYGHGSEIGSRFTVKEAGHPVPDENSVKYTSEILKITEELSSADTLLFLLSGGASSLFEKPLIPLDELKSVTEALLRCSADIYEINTIRKRLSEVKGGEFARRCKCHIECCILSDVIGDRLDIIASGPCVKDNSSRSAALDIVKKYNLKFNDRIMSVLAQNEAFDINNVTNHIVGNIEMLCKSAADCAVEYGYDARIITTSLLGEAKERGEQIAQAAIGISKKPHKPTVLIYGGETTVTVTGTGKGGRNQELALSAARIISGCNNITIFSLGSDGTDGPTDAAGGIIDGESYSKLLTLGLSPEAYLSDNNSYVALNKIGSLIVTGPTGTNVNDLTVAIIE